MFIYDEEIEFSSIGDFTPQFYSLPRLTNVEDFVGLTSAYERGRYFKDTLQLS